MRKMTKTVAVLAAMSAMTVASASLAFAATDNTAYSAIGKEAVAAGAASGEWKGNNADGWTFTPTDGAKLKGTWAQIDGAWYYFDKDGIMAREELVYLEGETYYFDSEGRMMANGWVGFDKDSDVVYDHGLDIEENIGDIQNPVFEDKEDAYETIWMYFNADGTAKDDEWFEGEGNLWYYFDDIIMVCGDFDHEINGSYYGFAEDGHMYVGWQENYNDMMKTAPNVDEKVWYYYETSGKKFVANKGVGNQFAWKKIDGNWYCFTTDVDAHSDIKDSDSVGKSEGTLIVNAYFANKKAGTGTSDYYYVDKKGVMATGVVTVDKKASYVTIEKKDKDDNVIVNEYDWGEKKVENVTDSNSVTAWFGSDGKAKSGWDGSKYYAGIMPTNIWEFNTSEANETVSKDAVMVAVTGNEILNGNNFKAIQGALVKSAFINKDGYYYVDKYGDKVVNTAVEVGNFGIDLDKKEYEAADFKADTFTASVEATKNADECKAYVLFGSNGKGYEAGAVDAGRTVKIGSKKYTATNSEFCGMQVFVYVNWN